MNRVRQQLRSMLTCEARDGGFRATLTLRRDFVLLPDHFPGSPILPGLCMVQAVLLAGGDLQLKALKNAKLMSPVEPGDVLDIDADVTPTADGLLVIRAKLSSGGKRTAEIALTAAPNLLKSMAQS